MKISLEYRGSRRCRSSGALDIVNGLSQMDAANILIEYSFANNYDSRIGKPPRRSFGKKVSGRVGTRKVDNIRVDAEPHSNKIQVQSGGGKSGYLLNEDLDISKITDKISIKDWVKKNSAFKDLSKGAKEQIVNNMWSSYE